jgi:hypothetical protein
VAHGRTTTGVIEGAHHEHHLRQVHIMIAVLVLLVSLATPARTPVHVTITAPYLTIAGGPNNIGGSFEITTVRYGHEIVTSAL